MLRQHESSGSDVPARLLYSSRTLEDVIYRDELERLGASEDVDVRLTLTRQAPDDWKGYRGRVNREMLTEVAWPADEKPLVYVCGPTGFVEAVAESLVELGYEADRVRTERFGPS